MKKAVVTGGNKGIGLEVTRYFLQRDYQVVVIARDFSTFAWADHNQVETIAFDVRNIKQIPELMQSLGTIDVLVNNAGIMFSLAYQEYTQEKIDEIVQINLQAPIAFINAVSVSMIAQQSGRIVNNASIAGQIGHPDVWYGVTKAGLLNATKSYAKLLGPHGIYVNAVAPSPVETEMLHVIPEARKNDFKKTVASGRFAKAEEVAQAIGWLGTESPAYVNGVCIDINDTAYVR